MEEIILGLALALLVLNLGLTVGLYCRLLPPGGEDRDRRGAEKAPEQAAADPIDQGFENIMRFSVHGKTGFERE